MGRSNREWDAKDGARQESEAGAGVEERASRANLNLAEEHEPDRERSPRGAAGRESAWDRADRQERAERAERPIERPERAAEREPEREYDRSRPRDAGDRPRDAGDARRSRPNLTAAEPFQRNGERGERAEGRERGERGERGERAEGRERRDYRESREHREHRGESGEARESREYREPRRDYSRGRSERAERPERSDSRPERERYDREERPERSDSRAEREYPQAEAPQPAPRQYRESRGEREFSRGDRGDRGDSRHNPTRRMLINVAEADEIRIAITEGNELLEFNIDRPQSEIIGALGNIYKGVVQNVEPAIQAAFIDIGLAKNGFLHVSDVLPAYGERWKEKNASRSLDSYEGFNVKERAKFGDQPELPRIQDLLRKGQEVLVQVTKSQIRHKGPSLSTYISLPGRYLVLMPNVAKRGVSRKIEDERLRRNLKDLVSQLNPPDGMGFIARTAAAEQTNTELQADLDYLVKLWKMILKGIREGRAPACVYEESDLVIRTIRDSFHPNISEIIVDDEDAYRKVYEFLRAVEPQHADRVVHYADDVPLFYKYGVEGEIEKTFDTRVPLRSGGFLVIEQTEALVSIDVNSGKFHDEKDAENMALKINLEAAAEICKQLRLRDLGGLIINDFIDMREAGNRRAVERAMRDGLRYDKAKTRVCRMSPLGLIEMTRQRVKASHKGTTYDACPHCTGTGYVKSLPSQTLFIMRKIKVGLAQPRSATVTVTGPLSVVHHLQNEKRRELAELEAEFEKRVVFIGSPSASERDISVTHTNAQGQSVAV